MYKYARGFFLCWDGALSIYVNILCGVCFFNFFLLSIPYYKERKKMSFFSLKFHISCFFHEPLSC